MKFLAAALALTTLAVSPALAASRHVDHRAAATMSSAGETYVSYQYGEPAAVFSDGQYLGRDPDPNVRAELLRGQVINAD